MLPEYFFLDENFKILKYISNFFLFLYTVSRKVYEQLKYSKVIDCLCQFYNNNYIIDNIRRVYGQYLSKNCTRLRTNSTIFI